MHALTKSYAEDRKQDNEGGGSKDMDFPELGDEDNNRFAKAALFGERGSKKNNEFWKSKMNSKKVTARNHEINDF